jgi:hypothetical protein
MGEFSNPTSHTTKFFPHFKPYISTLRYLLMSYPESDVSSCYYKWQPYNIRFHVYRTFLFGMKLIFSYCMSVLANPSPYSTYCPRAKHLRANQTLRAAYFFIWSGNVPLCKLSALTPSRSGSTPFGTSDIWLLAPFLGWNWRHLSEDAIHVTLCACHKLCSPSRSTRSQSHSIDRRQFHRDNSGFTWGEARRQVRLGQRSVCLPHSSERFDP